MTSNTDGEELIFSELIIFVILKILLQFGMSFHVILIRILVNILLSSLITFNRKIIWNERVLMLISQ